MCTSGKAVFVHLTKRANKLVTNLQKVSLATVSENFEAKGKFQSFAVSLPRGFLFGTVDGLKESGNIPAGTARVKGGQILSRRKSQFEFL